MSVEDSQTVDLVGVDNRTGNVVLTVSDHLSWESDEHLLILQKKLNAYFAFIESGELEEQYPDAIGRRPQITVVFKHKPSDVGLTFLERVAEVASEAGVVFAFEIVTN